MGTRIYLKLDDVKGQSRDAGFEDLIECESASEGVSQNGYFAGGQLTGASVSVSEFTLSKKLDKTSPLLSEYCCSAKKFKLATIQFASQVNDKYQLYYQVDLSPVIISAVSHGNESESLSLRFHQIKWAFTPFVDDEAQEPITGGWDVDASTRLG